MVYFGRVSVSRCGDTKESQLDENEVKSYGGTTRKTETFFHLT